MEWRDSPLSLSLDDFRRTTEKLLWLRLPKLRWAKTILAGFRNESLSTIAVRVTERAVNIPLSDLYSDVLEDRNRSHDLNVRVVAWNEAVYEGVVATVPAQEPVHPDLAQLPARELARALTRLRRASRGPVSELVKEVRRGYRQSRRRNRRSPASLAAHSPEEKFLEKALCAVEICLVRVGPQGTLLPGCLVQWKSRGGLASREFPDVYQELWSRFKARRGKRICDKGRP